MVDALVDTTPQTVVNVSKILVSPKQCYGSKKKKKTSCVCSIVYVVLQMFSDTLEKMRNELPFYSTEALQMRLENAKDSAIDEFDNLCESLDTSAHEKADDVVGRMTMDMAKECDLLRFVTLSAALLNFACRTFFSKYFEC